MSGGCCEPFLENDHLNLHTELGQNEYGNEFCHGLHTQIIINCAWNSSKLFVQKISTKLCIQLRFRHKNRFSQIFSDGNFCVCKYYTISLCAIFPLLGPRQQTGQARHCRRRPAAFLQLSHGPGLMPRALCVELPRARLPHSVRTGPAGRKQSQVLIFHRRYPGHRSSCGFYVWSFKDLKSQSYIHRYDLYHRVTDTFRWKDYLF